MTRWLLLSGTWHAWRIGERQSVCGTRKADQLRTSPAARIENDLPPEGRAACCGTCRKLSPPQTLRDEGLVPGGAGSPGVVAWLSYLKLHLKRVRGVVDPDDLQAVARLLAQVGTPDDPNALDLFAQIRDLLLTPAVAYIPGASAKLRREVSFPRLHEAVGKLQPRSSALAQVAGAMKVWRKVTGRTDPGRFKPDVVIDVMLALPPHLEGYVQHLKGRGLDSLAVVFHPNTLERAKRDPALRGVFGTGAAYMDNTADQLEVIR